MKKIYVLLALMLMLNGCGADDSVSEEKLGLLEDKVIELQIELEDKEALNGVLVDDIQKLVDEVDFMRAELKTYEDDLKALEVEKEHFRTISYKSLEFARARASGDIEAFSTLLSSQVRVYKEDDYLWAELYDANMSELLYYPGKEDRYHDMHIIYLSYNQEENTFTVGTEEHYLDANGEISDIGFVWMTFVYEEDQWKIDTFHYDI